MSDSHIKKILHPDRQELKEKLGSIVPPKVQILLEGMDDLDFFEHNLQSDIPNFRFIPATLENSTNFDNKSYVISAVEADPTMFGIVDMDYDFESEQVSSTENLIDTGECCCLLSWVMKDQGKGLIEVAEKFVKFLFKDYGQTSQINAYIRTKSEQFEGFVNESTKIRLFRGHYGSSSPRLTARLATSELEEIELKERGDLNPATQHLLDRLIPKGKIRKEFEKYKSDKEAELEMTGPNDHDFTRAVFLLIRSIPEVEGKSLSQINKCFCRFQSRKLGNREENQNSAKELFKKSDSFLEKLPISYQT